LHIEVYAPLKKLFFVSVTANGVLPGGSGTTVTHNTHKYTHDAQTKHSTQNYTDNKGHITHNEYKTMP
jgi:hypothetical protein